MNSHVYGAQRLISLHESPPLDRILSQTNPFHALIPYFVDINFNIILPSTHRPSKRCLFFRFRSRTCVHILIYPCVLHAYLKQTIIMFKVHLFMLGDVLCSKVFSARSVHGGTHLCDAYVQGNGGPFRLTTGEYDLV
jgi:hypothetical protein